MSDPNYVTIFNAANAGYRNWWFPAFGLIFVAVGLLMVGRPLPKFFRSRPSTAFGYTLLVFAILWTLLSFASTYRDYVRSKETLLSGKVEQVEGVVQDLVEVPFKSESFSVNGVPFCYSDNVVSAGFNHTSSYGGPIRPGLHIRVWYRPGTSSWNNEILKLEIRR